MDFCWKALGSQDCSAILSLTLIWFHPIFYLSIVFWLIPALNFSTMELDDSLFAPSCAPDGADSVMEEMADTAPCYTFIG